MSGNPEGAPDIRPGILVISEIEELAGDVNLPQLLVEMGGAPYRWLSWTVMDALMKALPAGLDAAILNLGLLTPLHHELLDKLRDESGLPVLVHLTDNRPDTLRLLQTLPGVRHLRKPASLHEVMGIIEEMLRRA